MELNSKYRCLYNSFNYLNYIDPNSGCPIPPKIEHKEYIDNKFSPYDQLLKQNKISETCQDNLNYLDSSNIYADFESNNISIFIPDYIDSFPRLNNNNNDDDILPTSIDLTTYFPKIYDQSLYGITSSCAIVSVISFYLKKYYDIDQLLSPFLLAYHQYLSTKSWESIDLYTGIKISHSLGIYLYDGCDELIIQKENINNKNDNYSLFVSMDHTTNKTNSILTNTTTFDIDLNQYTNNDMLINLNFTTNIDKQPSNINHKLEYFLRINFNINNIRKLLNNMTPILCSFKILPEVHKSNHCIEEVDPQFYNYLNNIDYWCDVNKYYLTNKNNYTYSVSVVIVGYDETKKQLKIRGCWGDNVGIDGYFYIDYKIIEQYNSLFFDTFIVDIKPSLNSNYLIGLPLIDEDINHKPGNKVSRFPIELPYDKKTEYILELDTKSDDSSSNSKGQFKKVSSMTNICETFIKIETLYELDNYKKEILLKQIVKEQ